MKEMATLLDVPALVAEVQRLRAELADCRAQVAAEARSHRATRLDLAAAKKGG